MQGPSRTHAFTRPLFTADRFVSGQWGTAQQKADFANALCRFIAEDFPRSRWTKAFYRRLHQTFGHIAHTDQWGFWAEFFASTVGKVEFLDQLHTWGCFGQPEYTHSDVERAVQARLRTCGVLAIYQARLAQEVEQRERAQFAALQAKYGMSPVAGQPGVMPAVAVPETEAPRPAQDDTSTPEPSRPVGVGPSGIARPSRRAVPAGQHSLL